MSGGMASDWIARLERHGTREALLVEGETSTYSQLARAATKFAHDLRAMGIVAGDLVAVLASPSAGGVALIHALLDRQIALFSMNARLTEAEQIEALASTGARILIVGEGVDEQKAKRLAAASRCRLITLSFPAGESKGLAERLGEVEQGAREHADHSSDRRWEIEKAIAFVLQTSGTSGRPKAAMLTRDNLIASAEASIELLGHDPCDRWLLCMPLFHIGGLSVLVRSVLAGTSVVIHDRFDAKRVAAALERDRITRVSFVATMLAAVLEVRGERPSPPSLELVLLGGGPASEDLLKRAESLHYPIAPTYGLTEAASQVATRPPSKRRDSSVSGREDRSGGLLPLPGVEIRIVDARREVLSPGAEGEIQVRGPIVMNGYLEDPEATSSAIQDGWLSTGDIGRLDGKGHLRVLDRRADLIISGGENIYPAEIESTLAGHPDLEDVGVVGCPDEKYGARPLAFVVLRPGVSFDRPGLLSFCAERLAGYKVPVDFIERARLPRTASGKLKRRELFAPDHQVTVPRSEEN